ncbi:MAG: hypothetical protein MI920_33350 [Kiloniellales bacterium]|nr:hypothetical protein [Kiloniellales bacterium]
MTTYCERTASLATKHAKEQAIARPFRFALGLDVLAPAGLDTDTLGTFTGEVPREGTPLEVCERKARLGMKITGLPFGLASEGSFGPHPFIPLIPAGVELLTFVDDERGFVLTANFLCESTNYGHCEARNIDELTEWLPRVGFPAHALIVRTNENGPGKPIAKGVTTAEDLQTAMAEATALSDGGIAWVEPDMRAHLNPTRMRAIRRLAFKLARRLAAPCPSCSAPGWGRTGTVKGLPCELCGAPTEMVRYELFGCAVCDHLEERSRRDGLQKTSPQNCPLCNP